MGFATLYLSYDGMTDPLGQSQVLPYLVELAKRGCIIHLISFEKPKRFEQHRGMVQTLCNQTGITWHPYPYTRTPPILSTLFNIKKMKKKSFSLHNQYNFKIVHCRSYITSLVGLAMQRKYNVSFLFDMRGFWADERVEGHIWNLKNPIFRCVYSYFKNKEKQYIADSKHTISLTEAGKKEILSWAQFRISSPEITVIPCCVDMNKFDPQQIVQTRQEALRTTLGLHKTDFILGYLGSLGTWYMLPEMLEYFKVLSEQKPNAKFLFVTRESPQIVKKQAERKNIPIEKIIIKSALYDDVPELISLFDVAIFFIYPTFSKKASSPTKQGEIMAMGIPLVCNSGIGDTGTIINNSGGGLIFDALTVEQFRKKPLNTSDYDPKKIRAYAEKVYSLDRGVKKYFEVYQKIAHLGNG